MFLAQALIAGLIIQASVICASPEPLHRIVEAGEKWGASEANDMLDGAVRMGECAIAMPRVNVMMKEPLFNTSLGAHIWSGEVNGFEVYLLVADDFAMGEPA